MEQEKSVNEERQDVVFGMLGQGITLSSYDVAKGSQGYTTAIAQNGIMEGCFYFEVKVIGYGKNGNIRVGITNDSLPNVLDTPVGTDKNSYGLRCTDGFSFNNRQGKPFTHGLKQNDVMAIIVLLEAIEPPFGGNKQIKRNESLILTFVNGEYCGIMYQDLPPQKYFAAASLYQDAELKFNLKDSEIGQSYLEKIPLEIRQHYQELENLKSYDFVSKNQADLNYSYYNKV